MATINEVNNSLTSATGTGSFVGSTSPVLTGAIDAGGATTLKIPNSSAPTVSTNGDLAIDTTFTSFSGMMTYYSGSQQYCPAILPADLATTNGYAVVYNSASSKFTMAAQAAGGEIVQYVTATSTSTDTTTSTSYVDTSLTASITPTNSNNIIWIQAYGSNESSDPTTLSDCYAFYAIRRTTGSAADLAITQVGMSGGTSKEGVGAESYSMICMDFQEVAGSTSTHTYVLRQKVPSANTSSSFGKIGTALMVLMELAV